MKPTVLELDEARARCADYPYVLVRELSRIWLGETREADINWDEITELRFFSESAELRLFRRDGNLQAVLLEDESEDDCLDKTFPLAHNGAFGEQLIVREYLAYDEDGQLFIAAERLKGWVK